MDPTNRYVVGAALILIVLIALIGILVWTNLSEHTVVFDDTPQQQLHGAP